MTRFGSNGNLPVKQRLGINRNRPRPTDARNILNRKKLGAGISLSSQIQKRIGGQQLSVKNRLGLISATRRRQLAVAKVRNLPDFTVVTPASSVRGGALALSVKKVPNSRVTVSRNSVSKTIVNDLSSRGIQATAGRSHSNPNSALAKRQVAVFSRNVQSASSAGRQYDPGSGTGMRATELELERRRAGQSGHILSRLPQQFLQQRGQGSLGLQGRAPGDSGINMFVTALKSAQLQESRPSVSSADHLIELKYDDDDSMDVSMEQDEEEYVPTPARRGRLRVTKEVSQPVRQPISGRLSSAPKAKAVKGHKIWLFNLKETVSDEDVKELCASIGDSLLSARLIETGVGEAVYRNLADAKNVVQQYHNRELDGAPMKLQLADEPNEESEAPTVSTKPRQTQVKQQRTKARPAMSISPVVKEELDEEMLETKAKLSKLMAQKKAAGLGKGGPDPDRNLITQAMFKGKSGAAKDSQSVTFTVKI